MSKHTRKNPSKARQKATKIHFHKTGKNMTRKHYAKERVKWLRYRHYGIPNEAPHIIISVKEKILINIAMKHHMIKLTGNMNF